MASQGKKQLVVLDQIEFFDTKSQLRIDRRQDKVDEWAEMLQEMDAETIDAAKHLGSGPKFEHPFPPIVVWTSDQINAPFYIEDGYHRVFAYKKARRDAIPAIVHVAADPRFEAFKHGLSANSKHGIPRTSADKRNAVRQALAEKAFQGMSEVQIAKLCDVSRKLVYRIKKEDAEETTTESVGCASAPPHEADTPSPKPPSTTVSTPREHGTPNEPTPVVVHQPDPEPESGPKDKLKREVPEQFREIFADSRTMADMRRQLKELENSVKQKMDDTGMTGGFYHLQVTEVFLGLKNVTDALKNAEYHTDCPACSGTGKGDGKNGKCMPCMGAGWLCGPLYEALPPKQKSKLSA